MSKYVHLGTVKVPIENYATQANAILGIKGSGKTEGAKGIAAIEKWVTMAEDFKNVAKTIAAFGAGEALVWPEASAPIHTQFPRCITFHPDRKKPELPKGAIPENVLPFVDTMRESLVSIEAEMKANDPAELKKQLSIAKREHAEMVREIERLKKAAPTKTVEPERVEVPVFPEDQVKRLITIDNDLIQASRDFKALRDDIHHLFQKYDQNTCLQRARKSLGSNTTRIMPTTPERASVKGSTAAYGAGAKSNDGPLPKGEAAILTAIAQHGGCTREQLTVLTSYKRSSRDTYLQRLGEKGLTESGTNGKILATDEGLAALPPDFEHLPTGQALQDYHMQRLPQGEASILGILIGDYPNWVPRERLSEATGYQRSSRDTYLQRLGARMLIETDRGTVRASSILFDE